MGLHPFGGEERLRQQLAGTVQFSEIRLLLNLKRKDHFMDRRVTKRQTWHRGLIYVNSPRKFKIVLSGYQTDGRCRPPGLRKPLGLALPWSCPVSVDGELLSRASLYRARGG